MLKGFLRAGFATIFAMGVSGSASAVTVEVARACNAAIAKAFPPRQLGNPAAGSTKGTAKDQRDYFNKCVANDGKVDDAPADSSTESKPSK